MATTTTTAALEQWALPRLQQLLPLDDDSLKQIVTYADSLSKEEAAQHLGNLLGDGARAVEFIAGFNLRRQQRAPTSTPSASSAQQEGDGNAVEAVPKAVKAKGGKKKANIHALPARKVEGHGDVSGGYIKGRGEGDEEYMARPTAAQRQNQRHADTVAANMALREKEKPDATQMPLVTNDASLTTQPITAKPPPSAAGPLVSDSLAPRSKKAAATGSNQSSRTASPAPGKAKVNISGGTAMHGASTALSDLDSAIRSLEIQTNPTLSFTNGTSSSATETAKRKCTCMATRHPLLDIAPNCLNCGKIICVKEGLGPCTFCNTPLLTPDEISKVLRVLKDERGEERQKANNAAHKKAEVAFGKARAYTGRDFLAATQATSSSGRSSPLSAGPPTPLTGSDSESDAATTQAKLHRDKLLSFQAQNARRTRIHDEAADFDVPTSGTNMWASPAERAQQLKRQQKVLREMEWNSRPEWERRRVVASIDLVGGRVVKRMAEVERPDFGEGDGGEDEGVEDVSTTATNGGGGGTFSNNPLAKGLIKPLAREGKGKGKAADEDSSARREKKNTWRRVQMDEDDNEQWILDGGVYGGQRMVEQELGTARIECG